jgi:hypothetical protein
MVKRKKSKIEEEFDAYVKQMLEKGDSVESQYNFEEQEELFFTRWDRKEPTRKIRELELPNLFVAREEKKEEKKEDLEEWFKP